MLDSWSPVRTEPVEAQAVRLRVDLVNETGAQGSPLRRVDFALEYRVLHALTEVLAEPRDTAQAPAAGGITRGDVVSDEHEHAGTAYRHRNGG